MACVIFHFGKEAFFLEKLLASKFKHDECVLRSKEKQTPRKSERSKTKAKRKHCRKENMGQKITSERKSSEEK